MESFKSIPHFFAPSFHVGSATALSEGSERVAGCLLLTMRRILRNGYRRHAVTQIPEPFTSPVRQFDCWRGRAILQTKWVEKHT